MQSSPVCVMRARNTGLRTTPGALRHASAPDEHVMKQIGTANGILALRKEMDRMFDRIWDRDWTELPILSDSYLPALDGLRALAVAAVLLFHADIGCLPKDHFRGFNVIPPRHLPSHRLTGREAHNGGKMDDRVRFLPFVPARILDGAFFGHIRFDKVEVGMMQERHQRFAAEEERVKDGDAIIKAQQFRGQEGTDIACAAGDEDMFPIHDA